MEDFYELARQIHSERKAREYDNYREKEVKGEFIYGDFKRWCIINGKDNKNANHFAEFLKSESVTLTPLQRRHIASKYFGYKFEYDCINDKWVVARV